MCFFKKKEKMYDLSKVNAYLFSSNFFAFCFSRFRIHIVRDIPDNKTAPPVAAPDAMAVIGDGGAVETLSNVNYLTFFNSNGYFSLALY